MVEVAAKRDPVMQDESRSKALTAEEVNAADDEEESDETDDTAAPVKPAAPAKVAPQTVWGDGRKPDSKVKRVLMPIPARKTETSKPAATIDKSSMSPQTMERARRVLRQK